MMGGFIPWKLSSTINQGSFFPPQRADLPAHYWQKYYIRSAFYCVHTDRAWPAYLSFTVGEINSASSLHFIILGSPTHEQFCMANLKRLLYKELKVLGQSIGNFRWEKIRRGAGLGWRDCPWQGVWVGPTREEWRSTWGHQGYRKIWRGSETDYVNATQNSVPLFKRLSIWISKTPQPHHCPCREIVSLDCSEGGEWLRNCAGSRVMAGAEGKAAVLWTDVEPWGFSHPHRQNLSPARAVSPSALVSIALQGSKKIAGGNKNDMTPTGLVVS